MKAISDKARVLVGDEECAGVSPCFWTDTRELTKMRLTGLVLVTTFVGFVLGSAGNISWWLLLHTLLGTALVAVSSSIGNQVLERGPDALMLRTRQRPIAAGRLAPGVAWWLGGLSAGIGVAWLGIMVGGWTAFVAGTTWVLYVCVYTPMKRVSSACTLVGAVAGALPPMVGWVAAGGGWQVMGWTLFGVLFFWQLPHFVAINWLYREEYEQAGFVMWSNGDRSGRRSSVLAIVFSVCLVVTSLLPWNHLALWGGLLLLGAGCLMVGLAWRFRALPSPARARALFFYTLAYLPLALGILMVARR